MSASDKTKLNGIEANANKYTLPAASGSTLGGVKTGSNITNSSGTISLTKTNVTTALGYTPPTTNTTYSTGTASYSGTTKLYTALGNNTDGTMTQKAIKDSIGTGYIIEESYDASTGAWYRKYSDGWIEQGGIISSSGSTYEEKTVTLLKPYANTNYFVCKANVTTADGFNDTASTLYYQAYNITKTSFKTFVWSSLGLGTRWFACGKG
jgi:hypothetical protein